MAGKIFISYRRKETIWPARALFERLKLDFGEHAFIDIARLRLGQDFAEQLNKLLDECGVMLAVVGPDWLRLLGERNQQLNKRDLMRHELVRALERKIPVVPVCIDGAELPDENDLPPDLRALVKMHALDLHAKSFDTDIAPLIREIQEVLGLQAAGPDAAFKTNVKTPAPALIKPRPTWLTKPPTQDNIGRLFQFTVNGASQYMRWIKPGSFMMGSPDSGPDKEAERDSDELLHRVQLTQGFWMADTACSQALWKAVLGDNPSHFSEDLQNPVEKVSWDTITQKFLPALNQLAPGLGAQLPTEAQWEYACRAGTQTPFHFGKQITPHQANYDSNHPYNGGAKGAKDDYREKTLPVRSLQANDWGLHQMHGNVWEWCADGYGPYGALEAGDPIGVETSEARVLRGGSWGNFAWDLRAARRGQVTPDFRSGSIGFRLCCVSPILE